MERVRQVIGTEGLQIPLPIRQRYGLQPGGGVVLELGTTEEIRILPAVPGGVVIPEAVWHDIAGFRVGETLYLRVLQDEGE
ncbi:MAG: hypothetical protein FJW34_26440 [Acidobacteria bacterium]|nr:hypothetical protein [Acidobacteriota bacterium]